MVKQVDDLGDEGNWGSDESEDDLQIVLNDTHVPTRVGVEDDEDGEDLVIVADGDRHHPGGEELELGEELPQGVVEGERKEAGEAARGVVMMAGYAGVRIEYSNHGYHPDHLQFKVSFSPKMLDSWPCVLSPFE